MGLGPAWTRRELPAAPAALPEEARQAPAAPDSLAALPLADAPHAETGSLLTEVIDLPSATRPSDPDVAGMDWERLKASVSVCTKCRLCQGRNHTVFGVGDERAKWLFVGEGPGRQEDLRGEPFVGPAGELLDNMLLAMQLRRGENAYIANIVKCRPTDDNGRDRPPAADEAAACLPYLSRQIELIQPAVIVALGKSAAVHLLGLNPDTPVASLRGKVHQYAGRPLIVTYHPAYLLRNTVDKRKAWADLCLAMATYATA
ncbi:uracil-DNA glycosylase [Noviherbaspirillum galbum]|uniref:Type-4 uracil-DNA glycosylase n=1 Tax=Noviherbaspirillum galbum TaxID=2709383 RepID=A0A6B3SVB0_9BURK|nr:uracil-DNA glycosylase [Noviherbaspirillum galbum]NEX62836.1 uracil-DNA glycosylase [Noviherbaspirillum galbum]